MSLLSSIVSLGGFLRGSKTILGALSLGYFVLSTSAPQFVPVVDAALQILGLSLLPIGVADKVLRK
jgi:hypothetical protein